MIRLNSFGARTTLQTPSGAVEYVSLPGPRGRPGSRRLPCSRILLENLLRMEDGAFVKKDDIAALRLEPGEHTEREIAFTPARVLLQDFTGVPAVVDLAAMRDAVPRWAATRSASTRSSPSSWSSTTRCRSTRSARATPSASTPTSSIERNRERYDFLRWGQEAFSNFRVVPPDTGIVHQVNLEYLARVVFRGRGRRRCAYPDTLVGTDSHTTMINGLGVLGWGVGGIEAEAAMLGQPVSMLIPEVVGFRLTGALPRARPPPTSC